MNYAKLISEALAEDTGRGDITTRTFIPAAARLAGVLLAKEACVVCGLEVCRDVFRALDKQVHFVPRVKDGMRVKKGTVLARISGRAQSILTAERVALNFLCLLSGVATKTRAYVEAVKPYPVKITDTRKTIPGLRSLQKYAVRIGGGHNHRLRLDEMILIKDNHLSMKECFFPGRALRGKRSVKWEVEADTLEKFRQFLALKPDIIMLDNMNLAQMRQAVKLRNVRSPKNSPKKPLLEASGRVTLSSVKKIAACGVDMISVGGLTHSVDSADISLEIG